MRTATVSLPLPPSVNNLFVNTGDGRAKSPAYRAWRQAASAAIAAAGVPGFKGAFKIAVAASDAELSRPRDVDNLAKPLIDALVKAGVLAGDDNRHLRAVSLEWSCTISSGTCEIEITELSPEPMAKAKAKPRAVSAAILAGLAARGIRVPASKIHVQ